MQIDVKLQGPLLEKITNAPAKTLRFIQQGLADASTFLFEKSQENAPKSMGKLKQGMRREIDFDSLRAEIWPSTEYAAFVHGPGGEGRTRPHLIPLKEAQEGGTLYRWAKKKGANPWAVRAAIAKRGTKYQPWLQKTAEMENDKVLAIISDAIQNVSKFLSD